MEAGAGRVVRVPRAGSPFCSRCEIWGPAEANLLSSRSLSLFLDPWFSARPDFTLPIPTTDTPGKLAAARDIFCCHSWGDATGVWWA